MSKLTESDLGILLVAEPKGSRTARSGVNLGVV